MLRNTGAILGVLLFAWLSPGLARAEGLSSAAAYVQLEIEVQQLTLVGMRERVALLASNGYSQAADQALDEKTRLAISQAYRRFNTSAGGHLAYGTRQAKAIEAWVKSHPEISTRYATLRAEFQNLSAQLNQLRRTP